MIWGPPGTGKTKTVGFMLHLILRMECRTLTCAPTNTAIVQTMIPLLKEPEKEYSLYLESVKGKDIQKFDNNGNVEKDDRKLENEYYDCDRILKDINSKKEWRRFVFEALKENNNKNKPTNHMLPLQKEEKSTQEENDGKQAEEKVPNTSLTFGEFVKKTFDCVREQLYFCTVNLHTHLPTSVISLDDVKNIFAAVDSLKSVRPLLHDVPNDDLKEAYGRGSCFTRFNVARVNSLFRLESLPFTFNVPYSPSKRLIREFCLEKACLIFCTASSSAKLHIIDMPPLKLLIIDEATQLKECESAIPLQLPGVRHAILVGDERQLPAMVRSQISEEAYFGRSLFESLSFLEHKKYLLNVQYRMHPSISLFPNKEFYDNQILDRQNVNTRSYNWCFLRRKIFNSYSYIDVSHGKEQFDDKRSRKNIVEVAVVSEII
ncbi:hypothetical protein TIFTF001_052745, partial [Ficus carica]